jgi:hypothetical protein
MIMAKKHRKPVARHLRKVDQNAQEDFAPSWGWEDESWRIRKLTSELEQMAHRALFLADRYGVRYRGRANISSDEH